jgi:hypothetical protein
VARLGGCELTTLMYVFKEFESKLGFIKRWSRRSIFQMNNDSTFVTTEGACEQSKMVTKVSLRSV